jgi:hypothetical protein
MSSDDIAALKAEVAHWRARAHSPPRPPWPPPRRSRTAPNSPRSPPTPTLPPPPPLPTWRRMKIRILLRWSRRARAAAAAAAAGCGLTSPPTTRLSCCSIRPATPTARRFRVAPIPIRPPPTTSSRPACFPSAPTRSSRSRARFSAFNPSSSSRLPIPLSVSIRLPPPHPPPPRSPPLLRPLRPQRFLLLLVKRSLLLLPLLRQHLHHHHQQQHHRLLLIFSLVRSNPNSRPPSLPPTRVAPRCSAVARAPTRLAVAQRPLLPPPRSQPPRVVARARWRSRTSSRAVAAWASRARSVLRRRRRRRRRRGERLVVGRGQRSMAAAATAPARPRAPSRTPPFRSAIAPTPSSSRTRASRRRLLQGRGHRRRRGQGGRALAARRHADARPHAARRHVCQGVSLLVPRVLDAARAALNARHALALLARRQQPMAKPARARAAARRRSAARRQRAQALARVSRGRLCRQLQQHRRRRRRRRRQWHDSDRRAALQVPRRRPRWRATCTAFVRVVDRRGQDVRAGRRRCSRSFTAASTRRSRRAARLVAAGRGAHCRDGAPRLTACGDSASTPTARATATRSFW